MLAGGGTVGDNVPNRNTDQAGTDEEARFRRRWLGFEARVR